MDNFKELEDKTNQEVRKEKPVLSPKKQEKIKVSIFKITNSHFICTDKAGNGYKVKRDNKKKLDVGDTIEIEK